MNHSKKTINEIDHIIQKENLDSASKLILLEIKKDIQYGKINLTNSLKSKEIYNELKSYVSNICIWLNLSENDVINKINKNSFNEAELIIILENILSV